MNIKPAEYWRENKKWKLLLGKTGRVIFSTWSTYSYALVEVDGKKYEMVGVGREKLAKGDKVICVLRRQSKQSSNGLVDYRIKVKKIN